jgi:hypothetical protein
MGMETLNSAARAAGFAMAVSDETPSAAEPKPDAQTWRSGEPVLKHPVIVRGDEPSRLAQPVWVKSLLNLLQRRAPA